MNSTSPPKTILFTDTRHIRCGDLEWLSPEGRKLPVVGPPEAEVSARASTGLVPHGIRLVAQPAKKTEPLSKGPPWGRIIFENGLYRSWYLKVDYPPGKDFGAYSTELPLSVAIGYSESKDGFEWQEKANCRLEVPGQSGFDGFTFFIPLTPAGRELRLNVRTKRAGEVRLGLMGVPGRSIADCDPIFGDSFAMPAHWKGQSDIGVKENERVTLHFKLRSAELFGLEWV